MAKALYWTSWRSALTSYAIPDPLLPVVAFTVPVLELLLVALMVGGSVLVGAALTVLLLGAFSMSVLRAMVLHRSKRLPCGCFGKMKVRDYRFLLVRNTSLGVLAALILIGGKPVDAPAELGGPPGISVLAAFFSAAAVALALHFGRRLSIQARKRAQATA